MNTFQSIARERMSLDEVRCEAKRLAGEVVVAWADQTTAYAVAASVDALLEKLNRLGLEPTDVILETIPTGEEFGSGVHAVADEAK
jgi:hypothetical protein